MRRVTEHPSVPHMKKPQPIRSWQVQSSLIINSVVAICRVPKATIVHLGLYIFAWLYDWVDDSVFALDNTSLASRHRELTITFP